MRKKTSKGYFKKICKNLNSYEFTEEFKKGKKQIEKDLDKVGKIKKLVDEWLEAKFPAKDDGYYMGEIFEVLK